jgi:hypothetical protein
MGSSTLVGWIKKNMDMDAKDPNSGKGGEAKPGASNQEIQKLRKGIARMKDFMTRAKFTPSGLAMFKARLKKLEDRLAELTQGKGDASIHPQGKRSAVSPAFAAKHPKGSYMEGRLMVGMEKGLTEEECEKVLTRVVPGLKITKSMFKNTILVVDLPDTHNEEQVMAALKSVKGVKYSELDGVIGIPAPAPGGVQIQPPPIKLGRPAPQPRR